MATVTLHDIRLHDYDLETMPLLKQLKDNLVKEPSRVCIERARYVTRSLRTMSFDDEPVQTKYAKAVNYFLTHKTPCFFDNNLLAGTTTSKPFGAPVYPEFTGMTIWPELDTMSTRPNNPQILDQKDAEELNFDIFPYWMDRNILEYTRKKHGNPDCMRLFERIVLFIAGKAGCISHTVPYYRTALEKGLDHIIAEAAAKAEKVKAGGLDTEEARRYHEFYHAVQIALKGIIAHAGRLGEKAGAHLS